LSHDDYHRLIDINQHGVFYGVKSTIDLLQESGGGDIVVTASRASLGPLSNDLAYSMSKHAVAGLVRSIAPDLITRGIRINAICPATVDTGFLTAGRRELEAAGITVMEPDEVAEGVSVILESGRTGECFVQLPGDPPMPFPFAPVPGR
jgi:NAD(P)-dependent dehydrogenase (short-subunit alcohol dehydrogenase family)